MGFATEKEIVATGFATEKEVVATGFATGNWVVAGISATAMKPMKLRMDIPRMSGTGRPSRISKRLKLGGARD